MIVALNSLFGKSSIHVSIKINAPSGLTTGGVILKNWSLRGFEMETLIGDF